jgi:hypothetical protein
MTRQKTAPPSNAVAAIPGKVSYPVDVDLIKEGYPIFKTKIVKLELIGFLIRFDQQAYFKVGEFYICQFKLPISEENFRIKCRVIKTYDAIDVVQGEQTVKLFTVELHFVDLVDQQKRVIKKFMERTGQKLT